MQYRRVLYCATLFFTIFILIIKKKILKHNTMAKSQDAKKSIKKEAVLSPKEKKAAKLAKKATRK